MHSTNVKVNKIHSSKVKKCTVVLKNHDLVTSAVAYGFQSRMLS